LDAGMVGGLKTKSKKRDKRCATPVTRGVGEPKYRAGPGGKVL